MATDFKAVAASLGIVPTAMNPWTSAALVSMIASLAAGLVVSGWWLARARPFRSRDLEPWLFAALMLLLVAVADRLTLLDGQLLALAALLMLWWRAARRAEPREPRSTAVGACGIGVLLVATAGIGMLAVAKIIADFASALRSAPGGFAALSWQETLVILGDVARSEPSLGGLRALAPVAWVTAASAVALMWITVLPPVWKRRVGRMAGVAMVLAGVWVATRVKMR